MMKARIIRRDISFYEDGVQKGYGDVVTINKEQLKSGNFAPLKVNVKPKKKKVKKDDESGPKKSVQSPSDAKE